MSQNFQLAIKFASTTAFALPPPWGIVASAGLSLFGDILGGQSASVDEVISFLKQVSVHDAAADVKSFYDYMSANAENIDGLSTMGDAGIKDLLSSLDGFKLQISNSIAKLNDSLYINKDDTQFGAISALCDAITGYLFNRKTALHAIAYLATNHINDADRSLYEDYCQQFRFELSGYSGEFQSSNANSFPNMLNQWNSPQSGQTWSVLAQARMNCIKISNFPRVSSDPDVGYSDAYPPGDSGDIAYPYTDDLKHARGADYMDNGPVTQILNGWTTNEVKQLQSLIPPAGPKDTLVVTFDTSSGKSCNYADNSTIYYKYGYESTSGPSDLSNETAVTIGKASSGAPMLTLSPSSTATRINVYSRLDGTTKLTLHKVPNSQTTWWDGS